MPHIALKTQARTLWLKFVFSYCTRPDLQLQTKMCNWPEQCWGSSAHSRLRPEPPESAQGPSRVPLLRVQGLHAFGPLFQHALYAPTIPLHMANALSSGKTWTRCQISRTCDSAPCCASRPHAHWPPDSSHPEPHLQTSSHPPPETLHPSGQTLSSNYYLLSCLEVSRSARDVHGIDDWLFAK